MIVAGGPPAALAAKAATTTIPIVFGAGDDPAKIGLVASLARPGGNLTGINFFAAELAAKRLELLREMVPATPRVAMLVDPTFTLTESQVRDAQTAARAMGLQIQVFNASTSHEYQLGFRNLRARAGCLLLTQADIGQPLMLQSRSRFPLRVSATTPRLGFQVANKWAQELGLLWRVAQKGI